MFTNEDNNIVYVVFKSSSIGMGCSLHKQLLQQVIMVTSLNSFKGEINAYMEEKAITGCET